MNSSSINNQNILKKYPELIDIILSDHSSKKTLIWGTNNYYNDEDGYKETDNILPNLLGNNFNLIKPRISKSQREQKKRSKDMAEVFTPSWMCNKQNNLVDDAWFGRSNVFNIENNDNTWTVTKKVNFKDKSWQDYVELERLEITCGEAPYLVSRYDTTTGEYIEVQNRIGLLDRKLRVINENVDDKNEWLKWVTIAYKRIYGYDYQGDNVILARENLIFDFIENYLYKFNEEPTIEEIIDISQVASWNIFQMDGLKYVIPLSCKKIKKSTKQLSLFDDVGEDDAQDEIECPGCSNGDNNKHSGIYVLIKDWKTNKTIKFIDLVNGGIL